jgi:hypothetical protein
MGTKDLTLYLKAQDPYDDATLERMRHPEWEAEWPQSGRKVKGHGHDAEIRRQHHGYPWEEGGRGNASKTDGYPDPLLFTYRRTSAGDIWIGESKIEQGRDEALFKVTIAELKDGLVYREISWVFSPFDGPEWRRDLSMPLVTPAPFHITGSVGEKPYRQILGHALDLLSQGKLESATASLWGDDAVIEFPQSGERFVGLATITDMLTRHPAAPTGVLVRAWDADNLFIAETSWQYAEERWSDIALYEFEGERVTHATEYFHE